MPPESQDNFSPVNSSVNIEPKKKFPKWLRYILVLLGVLLCAGVWYVLNTKDLAGCRVFLEKCYLESAGNSQSMVKDENSIADWQTYRNKQYGFEVKYPEELFSNNELSVVDKTRVSEGKVYEGVLLSEMANGCSIEVYKSDSNPFYEEINRANVKENLVADYKRLESNQNIYFIGLVAASRAVDPNECKPIFDQILSTFKFVE